MSGGLSWTKAIVTSLGLIGGGYAIMKGVSIAGACAAFWGADVTGPY